MHSQRKQKWEVGSSGKIIIYSRQASVNSEKRDILHNNTQVLVGVYNLQFSWRTWEVELMHIGAG